MRSRIAITALLAVGALMSGGGAALGVSALSSTNDASQAQYGPPPPAQVPSGAVLGQTGGGGPAPSGATAGEETSGSQPEQAPQAQAQPTRQLGAQGQQGLPFTGFAAIPLLLIGVALLVCGLVLRRGTHRVSAQP